MKAIAPVTALLLVSLTASLAQAAPPAAAAAQIPCSSSAPGLPCLFVCYPGLEFAVLFVGKGSVSGDCGGASASCSVGNNGVCTDISGRASTLDVGICSAGENSVGTFACISPLCTSCIERNRAIRQGLLDAGHPELAQAFDALLARP